MQKTHALPLARRIFHGLTLSPPKSSLRHRDVTFYNQTTMPKIVSFWSIDSMAWHVDDTKGTIFSPMCFIACIELMTAKLIYSMVCVDDVVKKVSIAFTSCFTCNENVMWFFLMWFCNMFLFRVSQQIMLVVRLLSRTSMSYTKHSLLFIHVYNYIIK